MPLDAKLLEGLLYEGEGTALDFKSSQYPFVNADVGEKAELIKDILAFANSWRRTTAYILIGVEEVRGGRGKVVGIESHLDDASLHQFVNEKTQRTVDFSYQVVPTEGTTIGAIEIPLQERPTYLTRRFGPLRELDVFIRDGSSTRVATPDEIAKMGAADILGGTPELTLQWAALDDRTVLPSPYTVSSLALEPPLPPNTFTRPQPRFLVTDPFSNPEYSREIIAYTAERAFFTGLGLRLQNKSGVVGKRIRFIGNAAKSAGMVIQDWIDGPPSRDRLIGHDLSESMFRTPQDIDLNVEEYGHRWEIEIDFGDVRPRDEAWSTNRLYIGSMNSGVVSLQGELRGDNLPEPLKCELEVKVEVERRAMEIADVAPYLGQA